MKKAVALDLGEQKIPLEVENKRCLYELSQVTGLPLIDGFVGNEVELVTLDKAISILNGDTQAPNIPFSTEDRPEQEAVAPQAEGRSRSGAFEGVSNDARSQQIRQRIEERLLHNHHPLAGCRDYEVRLGAIHDLWGTGLSRGSISRHIKHVVEGLEARGHEVYSGAGRYRLVIAD